MQLVCRQKRVATTELTQSERFEKLNKIAIQQMQVLENIEDRKLLVKEKK